MSIILSGDGSISGLSATGISAAQNLPSGSVVQVVSYIDATGYSTSSSSYQQGPQTGTFTLKNSANKVLVTAQMLVNVTKGSGEYNGIRTTLYRGSVASGTRLNSGTEPQWLFYAVNDTWGWQTISFLDTPNGNTTYSIGFNSHPVSSSGKLVEIKGDKGNSQITMMEIVA